MPGASSYALTEEHQLLRKSIRQLSETVIAPLAAETDRTASYPWPVHEALKAADMLALHVPAAYGGAGADGISQAIVVEEIARVCASSSLIPAVNKLGTQGMMLAGSEDLKARYLPLVARGEATFSYALSERDAGSDAASLRARAERVADGWVLNGSKCWVSNAGVSTHYTVMARTGGPGAKGISAFVVHADDPGFIVGQAEHKLGIKGSPTCELHFDGCWIPQDRIIGEPGTGFVTALRTLDHTRLSIGAQAVGIAQGALDFAAGYVRERRQFGKAIAEFQGVQFMIADMAMRTEAARQLVYSAAAAADAGDPELTFRSAAAKCFASDTAMAVTTDAVQLLGGYGYTSDFPVERMMRDAKITQIYEGTNQIQRVVMARSILK